MKKTKEELLKQYQLLRDFGNAFSALLSSGVELKINEDTKDTLLIEYVDLDTGTHLGELNYARILRSITGQLMVQNAIDSDIYPITDSMQRTEYETDGSIIDTVDLNTNGTQK